MDKNDRNDANPQEEVTTILTRDTKQRQEGDQQVRKAEKKGEVLEALCSPKTFMSFWVNEDLNCKTSYPNDGKNKPSLLKW